MCAGINTTAAELWPDRQAEHDSTNNSTENPVILAQCIVNVNKMVLYNVYRELVPFDSILQFITFSPV